MMAVPKAEPVTMPATETGAITVLLLLHTPVPDGSLNRAVEPIQTVILPAIAAGAELMVTVAIVLQPAGSVYAISAVPGASPVIIPVTGSAVAMPPLAALHAPPEVALLSVVVNPAHMWVDPVMMAGCGFTVIDAVAAQPIANE